MTRVVVQHIMMRDERSSMIKSMTGFGRCEVVEGERRFVAEIRAVNHRYLDFAIKMPKKLGVFEAEIRKELKNYVQRGKVDVYIGYEDHASANLCIKYNPGLAAEYKRHLEEMGAEFGLDYDVRVSTLARFPEVFAMEEQAADESELWGHLSRALRDAAEQFVTARAKEGENLRLDLLAKLDAMGVNVDYISERAPQIVAEYHERLAEKVRSLLADAKVDEARLLTEVAIFADKSCIDEELVRLKSHIGAMTEALQAGGAIGRKLDFIAQEMNREANTITAKATDISVTNCAIELKTEIEKIREQVQNIE